MLCTCSTTFAEADSKDFYVSAFSLYEGYDQSESYFVTVLSWDSLEDVEDHEYRTKEEALAAFDRFVKQYAA